MAGLWLGNSAYNHGLIILPVALYMAWERRYRLRDITVEPYWPGLILIAGFAVAWIAAHGMAISEGEQLSYIGLVQSLILTILGRKFFRALLLPILYLFLMVPTGTFLLPALQTVATWLTVQLLQLTSIPFFVDGYYIQLPVGLFFVAPGCAGLNFLLAALALSIVYVDLMYKGWQRKLSCILIWLAVAILANGVRIFLILWVAEISDKQLAIVDDHILYGWGFFLIILMGLMWSGRRFSNIDLSPLNGRDQEWLPLSVAPAGAVLSAGAASIVLVSALLGYGYAAFSSGDPVKGHDIEAVESAGQWRIRKNQDGEVLHGFDGADAKHIWSIDNGAVGAVLSAAYYNGQWEGHEAASGTDGIFDNQDIRTTARARLELQLQGAGYGVRERQMESRFESLIGWRWYCVDGEFAATPMQVRMRAFFTRLRLRQTETVVFTLTTPNTETARDDMTAFLEALAMAEQGLILLNAETGARKKAVCW